MGMSNKPDKCQHLRALGVPLMLSFVVTNCSND